MKLTVVLKLVPTPEQHAALLATLERANAAASTISEIAWDTQTFRQFALHKLVYGRIRAETGLSAQVVVRLEAKVSDAYKLDHRTKRIFWRHGAIAYDARILRYLPDAVSIWTVAGRQRIPFVCGERQRALLVHQQGESDLCYRDGEWFLHATCNYTEPPEGEPQGFLGVDMGIVNIATDSDGTVYSGARVNGLRRRHRRLRAKLQAKGTRAAKRLLAKRRRKERRFASHVNHTISKAIVAAAEGTGRGIALEDLQGIRSRVTVRQPQRATLHSWSFFQLRQFVTYKARRAGIAVALVDPRNTSRTCPVCGHCAKANRPAQSRFCCQSCGLVGLPDYFAALNIRDRAGVMRPYLAPIS